MIGLEQDDLAAGAGSVRSRGRWCTAYRTPQGRVRYWPGSASAGTWQYAGAAVAATFQLDDPHPDLDRSGPADVARAESVPDPAGPAPLLEPARTAVPAGMIDQLTVDAWLVHHRMLKPGTDHRSNPSS